MNGHVELARLPGRIREKISVDASTGCWVWTACTDGEGYGRVMTTEGTRASQRPRQAYRVVYEHLVGPVPQGLELDHLCSNRICCNPDHLEPVTHAENVRRGTNHWREQTHCKNGHEFTSENTYSPPGDNKRECRACRRARSRRWARKHRRRRAESGGVA